MKIFRGKKDIQRYPGDLGMTFELFDLSSIEGYLEWSVVQLFSNQFQLIETKKILQSDIAWDGYKNLARITGYYRPKS